MTEQEEDNLHRARREEDGRRWGFRNEVEGAAYLLMFFGVGSAVTQFWTGAQMGFLAAGAGVVIGVFLFWRAKAH